MPALSSQQQDRADAMVEEAVPDSLPPYLFDALINSDPRIDFEELHFGFSSFMESTYVRNNSSQQQEEPAAAAFKRRERDDDVDERGSAGRRHRKEEWSIQSSLLSRGGNSSPTSAEEPSHQHVFFCVNPQHSIVSQRGVFDVNIQEVNSVVNNRRKGRGILRQLVGPDIMRVVFPSSTREDAEDREEADGDPQEGEEGEEQGGDD